MTITKTFTIELTFTVDDEDADLMERLQHNFERGAMRKAATHQAMRDVYIKGSHGIHTIIMARKGTPRPKGFHIDHVNDDSGDNRRINLTIVTPSENMKKRPKPALDKITEAVV